MKKRNETAVLDCIDLADSMAEQAGGVIALGELIIAADPAAIDSDTLRGIGHLLTVYGRAMLDDSNTGSKAARAIYTQNENKPGGWRVPDYKI